MNLCFIQFKSTCIFIFSKHQIISYMLVQNVRPYYSPGVFNWIMNGATNIFPRRPRRGRAKQILKKTDYNMLQTIGKRLINTTWLTGTYQFIIYVPL